jgi:hypothetical protein
VNGNIRSKLLASKPLFVLERYFFNILVYWCVQPHVRKVWLDHRICKSLPKLLLCPSAPPPTPPKSHNLRYSRMHCVKSESNIFFLTDKNSGQNFSLHRNYPIQLLEFPISETQN